MHYKEMPEYIIDKFSLREELVDRLYAEKWCSKNSNSSEVVSFLRILGRLEEAKIIGYSFVSKECDILKKQYAILRLAIVYQWSGEYDLAKTSFLSVIEYATRNNDQCLLSFAYQHFGKFYFENGNFYKAREYGLKALEIRKKYWPDYAKSSQQFVEACNNRL